MQLWTVCNARRKHVFGAGNAIRCFIRKRQRMSDKLILICIQIADISSRAVDNIPKPYQLFIGNLRLLLCQLGQILLHLRLQRLLAVLRCGIAQCRINLLKFICQPHHLHIGVDGNNHQCSKRHQQNN